MKKTTTVLFLIVVLYASVSLGDDLNYRETLDQPLT